MIEGHFSAARTGAGSGASAICENERIGIELGRSRVAIILRHIFPAAALPYVPSTDAGLFLGPSSSRLMVSSKSSARKGVLRNAQPAC